MAGRSLYSLAYLMAEPMSSFHPMPSKDCARAMDGARSQIPVIANRDAEFFPTGCENIVSVALHQTSER